MVSAASCVREIFPTAMILGHRKRQFPIQVSIKVEYAGQQEIEIWSGEQESLFSKYPRRRRETMSAIRKKLTNWQNEFSEHQNRPSGP
jgi:hypothetical protein